MDEKSKSVFDKLVDSYKAAVDRMCLENVYGNYRGGLAEYHKAMAYADAAEMLRSEFESGDDDDAPVA